MSRINLPPPGSPLLNYTPTPSSSPTITPVAGTYSPIPFDLGESYAAQNNFAYNYSTPPSDPALLNAITEMSTANRSPIGSPSPIAYASQASPFALGGLPLPGGLMSGSLSPFPGSSPNISPGSSPAPNLGPLVSAQYSSLPGLSPIPGSSPSQLSPVVAAPTAEKMYTELKQGHTGIAEILDDANTAGVLPALSDSQIDVIRVSLTAEQTAALKKAEEATPGTPFVKALYIMSRTAPLDDALSLSILRILTPEQAVVVNDEIILHQ